MGGERAGGVFLVNVLVNLLADSIISQSIQPAFFISHMVSSGSLLSCDAMFFLVGSQIFGEKCIFWR